MVKRRGGIVKKHNFLHCGHGAAGPPPKKKTQRDGAGISASEDPPSNDVFATYSVRIRVLFSAFYGAAIGGGAREFGRFSGIPAFFVISHIGLKIEISIFPLLSSGW